MNMNAAEASGMRREFYCSVSQVLQDARSNACRTINFAVVEAYWKIGRAIVEEEQMAKSHADYGAYLIRIYRKPHPIANPNWSRP